MKIVADLAMAAWVPLVLIIFGLLPPRRAVIYSYLFGWLFLPFHSYALPLLPDFTKMSATTVGVLLGTIVFDYPRVAGFRFRWFDLPAISFCITPFFTSLANDLGPYDGLSGVVAQLLGWGLPYFIGRMYFNDAEGIRELAIAIFVGGLIYIPLCLFEIRMSPQLHNLVYGASHRGSGSATIRLGGYRPSVFLDSGLQLGMWMTIASLIGFWLWWTKALDKLRGISLDWLSPLLVVVTLMCRSSGALALLILGAAVLLFSRYAQTRLALYVLLLIAPIYIVTRTTGVWDGREITEWAGELDEARAQSFQFRIKNEEMLIAKALQRPTLGWGGWGRHHVFDDWGKDISITDGRWIIEFGMHGLVGLASLYGLMLLPTAMLVTKVPPRRLLSAEFAPEIVLAVSVALYATDCLPNAMTNPILMLVAGAVASRADASQTRAEDAGPDTVADGQSAQAARRNIARRNLNPGRVQ